MPPNLGGFFMVRSYYPSECHADYFDFERIEALKPAIEACGISTLSQSPMLGFHKQMDNRRSEERFSRNAETELVCRLLLEKKNIQRNQAPSRAGPYDARSQETRGSDSEAHVEPRPTDVQRRMQTTPFCRVECDARDAQPSV